VNGVHDMGGIQNMGPVEIEENEPVFHAEWEKRVFAFNMATGPLRLWNLDMKRQAVENLRPPGWYLNAAYYERWLEGMIKLLKERNLISDEELATAKAQLDIPEIGPPLAPGQVEPFMRHGNSARVDADIEAGFRPGDRVLTRNIHPRTHTRLPRYARDKHGLVERDHGVFIFPDTHAQSGDPKPQHVYAVAFTARELWGEEASPADKIYIDLWEDYLVPAGRRNTP